MSPRRTVLYCSDNDGPELYILCPPKAGSVLKLVQIVASADDGQGIGFDRTAPGMAALGFGAAAWTVAPRDHFIGWTAEQRKRNLSLIVDNARLLILPWITSRNLASRMLAAVAKRLPKDWEIRYGYAPVLLETFVEKHRFRGTCYRAANWILVGQTQGRGKPDRKNLRALTTPHTPLTTFPTTGLLNVYRRSTNLSKPNSFI